MNNRNQAIYVIHAAVVGPIQGETGAYDKDGNLVTLNETLIAAEEKRLDAAYAVLAYARERRNEYPSQGDQNDMIYKDMLNSTTTHKDTVEAVKTKWPKDNSGPVE